MATSNLFYFLLINLCIILTATARETPATTQSSKTYTYICHPERYANLGLDMSSFAFCDTCLSYEVRAEDLVNRLTLHEKVMQLGNKAYGVSRLGLPKYEWWSEALHGVSNVGPGTFFDAIVPGATSFPTVITTTAAFDEALWKKIGQVVSTEARAMYNLGRGGLTYWSPNINVVRDPRWGRALETPGEDPLVVGTYAKNYVRGLQDVEGTENFKDLNSRPLKVSSCCKHYAAYDIDKWQRNDNYVIERWVFDARVREQDMVETFLRPFEMCIKEGDVSSVMCSFNSVDGIPTCADHKFLNQTIRSDWDLHGYIVSDCDSIEVMVDRHKWLDDTPYDAVAQTLKAGLDLDCGDYYTKYTESAVLQGKVREETIDTSLKYLYIVLMRLGFFDGIAKYESLSKDDVCAPASIELAAEAAREGIVLLKNDGATLPLKTSSVKTLAVVGPHATATKVMIGNYAGVPCKMVSPIEGLSEYAKVTYRTGCDDVACKNESLIFPAMQVAKQADATIIVAGIDLSVEAEGLDRENLLLPGYQSQLINQVALDAKGPTILVLFSGGGLDISFAKNNPNVKAILWAGYPGEQGGKAIADIIFGKYNPGGRLPLTWYQNDYVDQLPITSMPLRPVSGYPGRTYKFFNGPVVYPFGYGLSYTKFEYKLTALVRSHSLILSKLQHCHDIKYDIESYRPHCASVKVEQLGCKEQIDFEIEVQNVGSMDGSEVVIVYSKPPEGILDTYIKQVIGFQRVFVRAGKSEFVKFALNVCESLGIVDSSAYKILPAGGHTIIVGDNKVSYPFQINYEGEIQYDRF